MVESRSREVLKNVAWRKEGEKGSSPAPLCICPWCVWSAFSIPLLPPTPLLSGVWGGSTGLRVAGVAVVLGSHQGHGLIDLVGGRVGPDGARGVEHGQERKCSGGWQSWARVGAR